MSSEEVQSYYVGSLDRKLRRESVPVAVNVGCSSVDRSRSTVVNSNMLRPSLYATVGTLNRVRRPTDISRSRGVTAHSAGGIGAPGTSYCVQVPMQEFERQAKGEEQQHHMRQLLLQLVHDTETTDHEKRKKLKQVRYNLIAYQV